MNEYLSECVGFLEKWGWIHQYKVVDSLVHDLPRKIPSQWMNLLNNITNAQRNSLPLGYTQVKYTII